MGLYEPKSFCICFDTKNGSLILGSLHLIIALLSIFFVTIGLVGVSLREQLEPRAQDLQRDGLDQHDIDNFVVLACVGVLIYYSISGICSSLLIHGIRKDRPNLMLPYIILDRICITFYIVLSIYNTGVSLMFTRSDGPGFISCVLPIILVTHIVVFCHLVVNAYHKQVKRTVALSRGDIYSIPHNQLINDEEFVKVKV